MSNREMVGRVYKTRKAKNYTLYEKPSGSAVIRRSVKGGSVRYNQTFVVSQQELGSAVLVLDQRAKRVKVFAACGRSGWLPYYYLLEDVRTLYSKKLGTIQEAVEALVTLADKVSDTSLVAEIANITSLLKSVQDE